MNPLAAVGALAAFVSEKSSLPQLGHFLHIWEALRRDMSSTRYFQSPPRHISALSRVDLWIEEKLLEIRIVVGRALIVEPSP